MRGQRRAAGAQLRARRLRGRGGVALGGHRGHGALLGLQTRPLGRGRGQPRLRPQPRLRVSGQFGGPNRLCSVMSHLLISAARRVPLAPAAAAPDHPGAGPLHRAGHQPAGGRHPAAEAEQQDQVQEAAPQEKEEVLCKSILEPYFWIV